MNYLTFHFGAMFSGKSQELYRNCVKIADSLAIACKENPALNPDIVLLIVYKNQSTRSAESSERGFTTHASNFTSSKNLKIKEVSYLSEITDEEIRHTKYIGIDEAFYPDLYEKVLEWILEKRISISIACIDGSATQQILCPQVTQLLPYATHIEKHKAYCHYCLLKGREEHAYYTVKINNMSQTNNNGGGEIDLGGSDKYHPVCLNHLIEKRNITSVSTRRSWFDI